MPSSFAIAVSSGTAALHLALLAAWFFDPYISFPFSDWKLILRVLALRLIAALTLHRGFFLLLPHVLLASLAALLHFRPLFFLLLPHVLLASLAALLHFRPLFFLLLALHAHPRLRLHFFRLGRHAFVLHLEARWQCLMDLHVMERLVGNISDIQGIGVIAAGPDFGGSPLLDEEHGVVFGRIGDPVGLGERGGRADGEGRGARRDEGNVEFHGCRSCWFFRGGSVRDYCCSP